MPGRGEVGHDFDRCIKEKRAWCVYFEDKVLHFLDVCSQKNVVSLLAIVVLLYGFIA